MKVKLKKKVLNFGCGLPENRAIDKTFPPSEWHETRFDIAPEAKPDIMAPLADLSAFSDAEFHAIWAHYSLDRLYAGEVPGVLKELARIMKPGGILIVALSDVQKCAEYVAKGNLEGEIFKSTVGPVSALDIIYGHGALLAKNREIFAKNTGFTARTLAAKLKEAGFAAIKVKRENFSFWGNANKPSGAVSPDEKAQIIEEDINDFVKRRDNVDREPELPVTL